MKPSNPQYRRMDADPGYHPQEDDQVDADMEQAQLRLEQLRKEKEEVESSRRRLEETHLRKRQGWSEKLYKLDFYGAPLAAEAAERLRGAAGQLRQTDFRSSR